MEEEKNYTINWVGLFIKVIVFVVVVLLAIWLITKLFRKDKGLTYEENLDLFKNSAVEYFKKNLPEGNEKLSVTLGQLISWDYLEDELTDEEGKVCDEKRSKATIEQIDDYYSIKLEFICGDESSTNYIKLGNVTEGVAS